MTLPRLQRVILALHNINCASTYTLPLFLNSLRGSTYAIKVMVNEDPPSFDVVIRTSNSIFRKSDLLKIYKTDLCLERDVYERHLQKVPDDGSTKQSRRGTPAEPAYDRGQSACNFPYQGILRR